MQNFNCDMCGLCCQNVDKSIFQTDFDRGDGVCKNYDEESHRCKIYKNRPLICNVDAYYEKFLKNLMTKQDFYEINYKVCENLRRTKND